MTEEPGEGGVPRPTLLGLADFAGVFRLRAPWVLFVGSPVSVAAPAGVPGVPAIVEALLGELGIGDMAGVPEVADLLRDGSALLARNDRKRLLGERRRVPFEVILGEIANHTGDFVPRFIGELVPSGLRAEPNANHRAISALLESGLADLVVTTNFDESQEAVDRGLSVSVPLGDDLRMPALPGLLKLHGTISRPETLAIDPDALAQRDRTEWREAVARALRGRNVLFVGYGFNDPFDVTPALRLAAEHRGTTFYWACRRGDELRLPQVPLEGLVFHDLYEPDTNVLSVLGRELAGVEPVEHGMGTTGDEQRAVAEAAVWRATAANPLSASEKLAALAALFYWIEEGEAALRYFRVAFECPGSRVDRHTLARAAMRARRFGLATRYFDRMLADELPADPEARMRAEVDWAVGAGFCASQGGHRRAAGRYYLRARRAFNRSGVGVSSLGPYLADQLLRSQVGHVLGKARFSLARSRRGERLRRAETYLAVLDRLDLALPTRPLVALERARIALARGDRRTALALVGAARVLIDPLRDPHAVAVCDRLAAIARRDRAGLAAVGQLARAEGRMLEWAKIGFEYFGLDGYGRFAWLERGFRDSLLASWDLAKDVLDPR